MAHNGKRGQINFHFLQGSGGFLYCDLTRESGRFFSVDNIAPLDPSKHDANGYMTTLYGGGTAKVFYIPTQAERPGNYIIDWVGSPGAGTIRTNFNHTLVSGSLTATNGRIVVTPDAGVTLIDLGWTNIGSPYISRIRMYHEDDEAKIIADPFAFQDKVKEILGNYGTIRFLDLQINNGSNVVNFADQTHEDHHSYYAGMYKSELWAGYTTNSGDDYSATLSGFVLADKAKIQLIFNATSAGYTPRLRVNGGAYKDIRDAAAQVIAYDVRKPTADNIATLVYDSDLDVWIKRGGDTELFNTGLNGGVPFLHMTKLCKEMGCHMWVCTPPFSVDPMTNWTTEAATAAQTEFAGTGLKYKQEGPNELWNDANGFDQTPYAEDKETIHSGGNIHAWYGRVMSKIGKAVNTVFSDDRTKYDVICGVQAFGSTVASDERLTSATYVTETGNASDAAYNWVTIVSPASYYTSSFSGSAQELAWAAEYPTANAARKLQIGASFHLDQTGTKFDRVDEANAKCLMWYNWAVAKNAAIKIACYEGGYGHKVPQASDGDDTFDAFINAMNVDPSLVTQTMNQCDYIDALGGGENSNYVLSGTSYWSSYNPTVYTATPSAVATGFNLWNDANGSNPPGLVLGLQFRM